MIAIAALVIVAFARTDNTPRPDNPPATFKVETHRSEPRCLDSVKAISFYRQAYRATREKMGRSGPVSRVWYQDCAVVRRRAVEWRDRAADAKLAYDRWHEHHYRWEEWLPRGWYRVGSCETGYGGPPNWRHRNSRYEGGFGFAVSTWDQYSREAPAGDGPYPASAADATPRQQYNVALVVHGHFGLSGWGCRGAYYGR